MALRIGVIGGSGLYEMEGLENLREEEVDTPFGDPSAPYVIGAAADVTDGEVELVFLPRHGKGHRLTPSEVPYRANIFGMKALGVSWIVSVSAVGSLKKEIAPGDLVLVDQFIDRTRGRASSFFEDGIVAHVSFGDPILQVAPELPEGVRTRRGRDRPRRRDVRVHGGSGLLDACRVEPLPVVGRLRDRDDEPAGSEARAGGGDLVRNPRHVDRLRLLARGAGGGQHRAGDCGSAGKRGTIEVDHPRSHPPGRRASRPRAARFGTEERHRHGTFRDPAGAHRNPRTPRLEVLLMTQRLALFAALLSVSCVTASRQKQAAAQADLGAAYLREGSLPDAVMALERAVKDDPRNWDAWQKLGLAYGASRAEDRARDAFDHALDIAPKSGEVNANYGAYLIRVGDVDAAIERLQVAKADLTYRNTANVLNNLGIALYAKGVHDEAIAVLSEAVQRAPNQWQARFHRGLAYQAKGEPKLAAADFDAVIQLSKGTMTESYVRGAESQLALGNAVAACAYLDQVLNGVTQKADSRPDEVMAYEALVHQADEVYRKSCTGATRP